MTAHKIETVLKEDGCLVLTQLPFRAGANVEVIVLERQPVFGSTPRFPFRGLPYRFDNPTDPVAEHDWNANP